WASGLGAFAIFLGVLASFFATRYLRNLLSRDQMLLPAKLISEELKRLQSRLKDDLRDWTKEEKQRITECPTRIETWITNLSSKTLEGRQFIPSRWPVPSNAVLSKTEDYHNWLQNASDWTTALGRIVRSGLEEVRKISRLQPPPPRDKYLETIDRLDRLAI